MIFVWMFCKPSPRDLVMRLRSTRLPLALLTVAAFLAPPAARAVGNSANLQVAHCCRWQSLSLKIKLTTGKWCQILRVEC